MATTSSQVVGRWLACLVAALALAIAGIGIAPAVSAIAAATCPTAPADYVGADETLDELRDSRIDAAATCEALLEAQNDVQTAVAAVRTTDTVSLSGTDREQADDIQGAMHADLWFLSGLLAATLVGGIVAREFLWR